MRKLLPGIVAASLIAFILLYAAIEFAQGVGWLTPSGYSADLRSGVVTSVASGGVAERAGVRVGDRIDFGRGGWALHLSVDRTQLLVGRPTTLPLLRDGRPITAVLAVQKASPPPDAWAHFVNIATLLLYSGIGAALFLMRRNAATLVLLVLACGGAVGVNNLDPMKIALPEWMPVAMLVATIGVWMLQYGLLYFGILFSNRAPWAEPVRRYVLLPLTLALAALYYYHFYAFTIAPAPFNTFLLSSILNWLVFVTAAISITARVQREADSRQLRWVSVGIWAQAIIFAAFNVDQNLHSSSPGGSALIRYVFAWFQPAPVCIAYVLMHTRIVDARIVGARTLVYGVLTAIPIGLFSIADWMFSRELADARLATFAEFAVAVLFGIWLNTLHKRIDRFVERIVFASRHHAFQRLRHGLHALASVEQSETATDMICTEAASALHLASAAVFMERGDIYERVTDVSWNESAQQLRPDDPLVLYPRAAHHAIRLADVAPSQSTTPEGDAKPEIAIPIMQHHRTIGVVLYGKHRNGEHLDADEETLLSELAQAAGAALDRLQSIERVRELEAALELQQRILQG